jgi:hypothetical protein
MKMDWCFSYNCRKHIDVVDIDALVGVMAITVTDSHMSIDYCSSIASGIAISNTQTLNIKYIISLKSDKKGFWCVEIGLFFDG